MADQVIVEGDNLTVTTTTPDPKRRRPPAYVVPKPKRTGRTMTQMVNEPNPYWSEAENAATEEERL